MGDAVAEVVTEVVVAVVVSEVASTIAEKVGLSDSMANLVGIGAAGYVAHARTQEEPHPIFGGGTGGEEAPTAGMDLSTGIQGVTPPPAQGQPVAPSDVAPSGPAPNAVAGLTDPGGQGPGGTLPAGGAGAGMLTQGQATPGTAPPPDPVPTAPAPTVQSSTVGKTGGDVGEDSYWSKLFSSERTMDMLLAGIGGAAKDKQATEEREYPEKVAKANEAEWLKAGTGNLGKLRQSFPGQGYLSSYQQ